MKKKKFLAMLLSGCLMVSLLSGCGSSGESADSGASDGGSDASPLKNPPLTPAH